MANTEQVRNDMSGSVAGDVVQAGPVHGSVYQGNVVHGDVVVQPRRSQPNFARHLANHVRKHSSDEEENRQIHDPRPLSVHWRPADESLVDDSHQGDEIDRASLDASFTAIRQTYEAIPSRRLVILGRAGSGKTMLAHHLILALLDTHQSGDSAPSHADPAGHSPAPSHEAPAGPIPVLFTLSSWDPKTLSLRKWMVGELVRDFPFLETQDSTGTPWAEVLVDSGWILAILDGFDEIPRHRRRDAISEISRVRGQLVVTSRPAEYAAATQEAKALGGFAAIELEDLNLEEAQHYLETSANPGRSPLWTEVFDRISASSEALTPVLTSPFMVVLARTVYNDAGYINAAQRNSARPYNSVNPDPRELLDTARFATSADVENYLLSAYLDAVYDPRREGGRPSHHGSSPGWTAEQVRPWLRYLATHLSRRKTYNFTWWHLAADVPRKVRLCLLTAMGLAFALPFGLAVGVETYPWYGSRLASQVALTYGLTVGIAFGLAVALINEIGFSHGRNGHTPERLRPNLHLRSRQSRPPHRRWSAAIEKVTSDLWAGLSIGLGVGLAYGSTYQLSFGAGPRIGLVSYLGIALGFGLLFGILFGLTNFLFNSPENNQPPPDFLSHRPSSRIPGFIVIGRVSAVILVIGLAFGMRYSDTFSELGASAGAGFSPTAWIGVGLGTGLLFGPLFGFANAAVSTFGDTQPPGEITDPWHQLATDRSVTLARVMTAVLVVGLAFGALNGIKAVSDESAHGAGILTGVTLFFTYALLNGLAYGVAAGLARLAASAWGNWLLIARFWLPLTGRLPWQPQRFLEDAYRRGMLRRAGAVYQFRHAQLRDYLADRN